MATVLVVDASASVRETLRIVLGHEHDVLVAATIGERPRSATSPDVVVLGLPAPPRDERALGALLERDLPKVPRLLLHPAREIDVEALVPPHVAVEFLPKPFDAYGIRARVRHLLELGRAGATAGDRSPARRRVLEHPFLSHSAAAVVRRVLTADLPIVLIQGEDGTGVGAVARALHAASGRRGAFVAVDGARLADGELDARLTAAGDVGTLFVANVDRAPLGAQSDLLRCIEDGHASAGSSLRVVVGAHDDLGLLASAGRMLAELAYLAATVPIALVPLRERTDDIPALVDAVTRDVCARLRLETPTYRPAALERLRQYLWFGNVAELEAVLARTLTLHRPAVVEADDLVFLSEATPQALVGRTGASAPAGPPTTTAAGAAALAGLDLEVVLGELAHDLRNPMVTIKTVAQHLDAILADPNERARFAMLMTDAIGRMDGLLETLLDFARFRAPTPCPIELGLLVDRVLDEQTDELARRHVSIERNGAAMGTVLADEAQVLFAFRSLCRGLVTDLVPHSTLAVRGVAEGVVEMRVRTDPSVAARLAAWVAPGANGKTDTPPLAWALAAALLERNGGALTVRGGTGETTVIRVAWERPSA